MEMKAVFKVDTLKYMHFVMHFALLCKRMYLSYVTTVPIFAKILV